MIALFKFALMNVVVLYAFLWSVGLDGDKKLDFDLAAAYPEIIAASLMKKQHKKVTLCIFYG